MSGLSGKAVSKKEILWIASLAALIVQVVVVGALVCIPLPELLEAMGHANLMVPADVTKVNEHLSDQELASLVKKGALIGIEDLWQIQSGFYTTLIGFLVAINGLLVAGAIFYIKGSSEEKAEHAARDYMLGELFELRLNKLVDARASERMRTIAKSAQELVDGVDIRFEALAAVEVSSRRLEVEVTSLMQQNKVIAERLALLDSEEEEGAGLNITDDGVK